MQISACSVCFKQAYRTKFLKKYFKQTAGMMTVNDIQQLYCLLMYICNRHIKSVTYTQLARMIIEDRIYLVMCFESHNYSYKYKNEPILFFLTCLNITWACVVEFSSIRKVRWYSIAIYYSITELSTLSISVHLQLLATASHCMKQLVINA